MAVIVENPNTISGAANATTVQEYQTTMGYFRVELRRLISGGNVYMWTRVTVNYPSNYYIDPILTMAGTTVRYGWSSGDNQKKGSVYCTKAIGYPTQAQPFSGKFGTGTTGGEGPEAVAFNNK